MLADYCLRLFIVLALSFCNLSVKAIPASPNALRLVQPDGSEVTARLVGDENFHYYTSEEGLLLLNRNGYLCYAVEDSDGRPVASDIPAEDFASLSAADRTMIGNSDNQRMIKLLAEDNASTSLQYRRPGLNINSTFPTLGYQRALVILVEYQDVKFRLNDPADYFRRMLNQEDFSDYGATGSARDYYLNASDGRFSPNFDVLGPITLPHTMSWYGRNNNGSDGANARMMAVHACDAVDQIIDFHQYDRDNDGTIDNVFIFYAGLGEATGGGDDTVWPHSADVIGTYTYDGLLLKHYGCTNEWIMDSPTSGHPDGVGTFCHEFAHVLGLPDLYATTYPTPAPFTPGAWSLLDVGPYNNNGRTPPALDLFSRYALGWWDPVMVDSAFDGMITPLASGGNGYMVPTSDPNEYFLIENRQKIGWDRYVPGHGMLVWHVEYNLSAWMAHSVNNDYYHQYVDILEADGKPTESTRSGDTFPGVEGVTSITGSTSPGFVTAAGVSLNVDITDIAELPDGLITFKAMGGATPAQAVTAYDATDVTPRAFVAHWQADADAVDYRLSVYSRQNDKIVYANGYCGRLTGLTTSCLVEGLDPDTQYIYTVAVVTPTANGAESNEISVTTHPLTTAYIIPQISEVTDVDDTSFTANWLSVSGATDYLITVESRYAYDIQTLIEGFDGKTAMWSTNSSNFYAADSYVGNSAPSLRLSADGYVATPVVEAGSITGFSFWHRGRNADDAYITVDVYGCGCWRSIATFPLATDKGGATYSVHDFADDAVAVRIYLHDDTGKASIYVDDFELEYTSHISRSLLYDDHAVGPKNSAIITGLQSGSTYFYSVKAICGDVVTLSSAKQYVRTTGQTGIGDAISDGDNTKVMAVEGAIKVISSTASTIEVYDLAGRQIVSQALDPGTALIHISTGIYLTRINGETHRIIVK